jgi:hypothetical protein
MASATRFSAAAGVATTPVPASNATDISSVRDAIRTD